MSAGKPNTPARRNSPVISDASCLIGLANIGRLDIPRLLYGTVFVTPEVAREYALALPEWVRVKAVTDGAKTAGLYRFVDLGEASAIALAAELGDALLIVDDRRARRLALDMGLEITGTLGLLIRAYEQGIIENIESIVADLRRARFRLPENAEELIKKSISSPR
jgi:predicted nucleic acid-binding protein